jgi:hypothetical protein
MLPILRPADPPIASDVDSVPAFGRGRLLPVERRARSWADEGGPTLGRCACRASGAANSGFGILSVRSLRFSESVPGGSRPLPGSNRLQRKLTTRFDSSG